MALKRVRSHKIIAVTTVVLAFGGFVLRLYYSAHIKVNLTALRMNERRGDNIFFTRYQ